MEKAATGATVFISYRRIGARMPAVALAFHLRARFGDSSVFIDTSLTPGERYPEELEGALAASEVVVAVVHDGWVTDLSAERHKDWVHHELSTAFRTRKAVIPVLLDDAAQPTAEQLPADIVDLALIQATSLRSAHYGEDLARLVTTVERKTSIEVPLAVADPAADVPARPGLRLLLSAAAWGGFFAALPAITIFEDIPMSPSALAAVMAVVLVLLTVWVVAMAALRPRLDALSRRGQERSFRSSVKHIWPGLAFFLAMSLIGVVFLAARIPGLDAMLKALLASTLVIGVLWFLQRKLIPVLERDKEWPPSVTPDPFTFRWAAASLRERLNGERGGIRDVNEQRQAESVLAALSTIRTTLDDRARRTWRQWLVGGGTTILEKAVIGISAVVLVLTGWSVALDGPLTRAPFVAVTSVAVALVAAYHGERRSLRRLVAELDEWDAKLRPLVIR